MRSCCSPIGYIYIYIYAFKLLEFILAIYVAAHDWLSLKKS